MATANSMYHRVRGRTAAAVLLARQSRVLGAGCSRSLGSEVKLLGTTATADRVLPDQRRQIELDVKSARDIKPPNRPTRFRRLTMCFIRLVDAPLHEYAGFMDYSKIITIEPGKRSGKPCIRGMRITVSDVLEYLASGMTEQEVLKDFPELTQEDIRACLAFAADREKRLTASVA